MTEQVEVLQRGAKEADLVAEAQRQHEIWKQVYRVLGKPFPEAVIDQSTLFTHYPEGAQEELFPVLVVPPKLNPGQEQVDFFGALGMGIQNPITASPAVARSIQLNTLDLLDLRTPIEHYVIWMTLIQDGSVFSAKKSLEGGLRVADALELATALKMHPQLFSQFQGIYALGTTKDSGKFATCVRRDRELLPLSADFAHIMPPSPVIQFDELLTLPRGDTMVQYAKLNPIAVCR